MSADDDSDSVSDWIDGLKAGDPDAARRLWECFYGDLVHLARHHLRGSPTAAFDEEDAALSAFESFCRGAQLGRFPRLDDRADLWRILVTITARKAADLLDRERRQKRGGGRVLDEAALDRVTASFDRGLDQAPGEEPTPELAAIVVEEYKRFFGALPDGTLRLVALLRLEGYADEEIAASLGCGLRTVERKLNTIRSLWTAERAR